MQTAGSAETDAEKMGKAQGIDHALGFFKAYLCARLHSFAYWDAVWQEDGLRMNTLTTVDVISILRSNIDKDR